VLAADFHVHGFPGDGALPAWELAREASRRGLHAVVISNHNQTLAAKLAAFAPAPVLIIPSQEVTTPRFHLVAAGIARAVDWWKPELEIVNDIHAQGGVVIAAHPIGRYWRADDAMLAAIDGAEVAHPLTGSVATGRDELTAFFARAKAVDADIAPIGSSDFHFVQPMGLARTYVLATAFSETGVLDAVREGRTVAYDVAGNAYGDPALVQMVEAQRQQSSALRSDTGLKTVGTLMSWASLLLAVAIGPRLRRPRS